MIQVNIQSQTIQFEASAVLAELACRVLIGQMVRPPENAPTAAIRGALRSDFASAIGTALKAEETGSRNRAALIERLTGAGLDAVGAELRTPRTESEIDQNYRRRLTKANEVSDLPLHRILRETAGEMVSKLVESEPIAEILSALASTYGIE